MNTLGLGFLKAALLLFPTINCKNVLFFACLPSATLSALHSFFPLCQPGALAF